MRFSVAADEACAVNRENDGKVRQADIVFDFVVSALQESGVDGNDGAQAARGEPACESDGVLFCDTHVDESFWEFFCEIGHTGSAAHSCGDDDDFFIIFCGFANGIRKDFCISWCQFF